MRTSAGDSDLGSKESGDSSTTHVAVQHSTTVTSHTFTDQPDFPPLSIAHALNAQGSPVYEAREIVGSV